MTFVSNKKETGQQMLKLVIRQENAHKIEAMPTKTHISETNAQQLQLTHIKTALVGCWSLCTIAFPPKKKGKNMQGLTANNMASFQAKANSITKVLYIT